MKLKKILLWISVLCCIGVMSVRFYYVNKNADVPQTMIYEKGDRVAYEKDFTDDATECIEGYSVIVKDSVLVPVEEYYKEYLKVDFVPEDDSFTKYYYIVKAEFRNENNRAGETMGVNLAQTPLVGKNYMMVVSYSTFTQLNPDLQGLGFSLREGTSYEILLPYAVVPETSADYDTLSSNPPMLQITEYPHRKLLKI